jgi:hypothetical protein
MTENKAKQKLYGIAFSHLQKRKFSHPLYAIALLETE